MSQIISSVFPSWTISPFTQRPDPLAVEVPVGHEAGPERAERVRALHAQHRARVGVAEVVQAEVVRDRVADDVLARPRRARCAWSRRRSRSRSRPRSSGTGTAAAGRRRPPCAFSALIGLWKYVGAGSERGAELGAPALVVQVDADDLRGLARAAGAPPRPAGAGARRRRPARRRRAVTATGDAVQHDPSASPCRLPGSLDPEPTVVCPRGGAAGVHVPEDASGRGLDRAAAAVALLGRRADAGVPHRPGERGGAAARRRGPRARGPRRRRADLGRLAELLGLGRGAARPGPLAVQGVLRRRSLRAARARPTRAASSSGSTRTSRSRAAGTRGIRRSSAHLDDAARDGRQGRTPAGGRRRVRRHARRQRPAAGRGPLTIDGPVRDRRVRERPAHAALPLDAGDRPGGAAGAGRARDDAQRGRGPRSRRHGRGRRRGCSTRRGRSWPRSRPCETIAGYWRQVGATFAGGQRLP